MAILGWFLTPRGALVALFGVMFVAWQIDRTAVAWRAETKGAAKVVAKIDRANDNATQKGKRAAAAATAPGVRGARDPSTRDD
jgi:hypothetical protein